jgi:hypothetical protein
LCYDFFERALTRPLFSRRSTASAALFITSLSITFF